MQRQTVLFLYSVHAHCYRDLVTPVRAPTSSVEMSLHRGQTEDGAQLPTNNLSSTCLPMDEPAQHLSTIRTSSSELLSTGITSSISIPGNTWLASQCSTTSSLRLPQGPTISKMNLAPINKFPSMSSLGIEELKLMIKSSQSTTHDIYLSLASGTQHWGLKENASTGHIAKIACQGSHSELYLSSSSIRPTMHKKTSSIPSLGID